MQQNTKVLSCRQSLNRAYHQRKQQTDLNYRLKKLLTTIQHRCNSGKGRKDWEWYGGKGIKNHLTLDELRSLWCRDHASLLKRPSIDRRDHNADYSYRNCRFIELADNVRLGTVGRKPRNWRKKI